MRRLSKMISLTAMATATAFAATPAAAQVTGDEDSVLQDAEEGFGVIVITAQRREENLQDVPISVATVGDDTLAAINAGGADIRGLAGRVPSLNIESSFGRTFPRFYIRGLGNTDFDLNASQPVSLVYDEVVLENPILKGFPVFDLDRVEVLRGPQGTLFGRNTPAGIVKFDTVKPGLTAENYAKASWGSYNSITAEAGVGAMLADNVAVRVSGLYQHRDDWIDNLDAPGENNLEGYDDVAARVQLLVEPNEASSLRLTGQLRSQQGSARVFRANLFETGSNELVGVDGGEFVRSQVRGDGLNFQELDNYNLSAHFDYDLGPVTLYSITSYWAGELYSRGDIDGGFGAVFLPDMGPGFIPFPAQSQDNIPSLDQFTQELRIASNNTDGLGYQAGVFYFNEKIDIESFDFATPTDLTPVAIVDQRQDAEALGLFGSLSYAFDSGLTLQAGARYNLDDKTLVAERPLDGRAFFGGPVPAMTLEADDEVLTWDVSGVYEVDDQINLFARVAKGYRAPSLQGRILFDRDMSRADSETTMSYEAGVKTSFDSVMFNLTGYMFTTDDLQLSAVGGATNANLLLNAEEVNGSGIEAELMARPARGLTLTAGVSYNSAKIDDPDLVVESCGAACIVLDPVVVPFNPATFDPAQVLIDGNQLPQAPEWTANWTLGYEHPVGAGDLYLFTDWYYRSKINFFLYESVEFSDDRLLEGGLRVGYKTDDFDVAVFARNILDDKSAVGGIDFNNLTGFVNEPRIIGAEVGVNF